MDRWPLLKLSTKSDKKEPVSTNTGGIVMAENNTLGNTGIEVIEPLQDEKVIDIVNQVSTRIMTAFPDSNLSYLDIFKTLLDTPMYYARIPKGLSKANYYYPKFNNKER